ncbi:MAG: peptidylprolyl isomerase, partial [Bacteroidetes bacterium QH_1_61_8]
MGAMNKLRQNTGVILWILVISFGVIWTLQDSDVFSAMNQTTRNVATVNGTPIQQEEYQRVLKRQRQRFQQQLDADMNPQMESRMREQAYDQVVNQELLQQEMGRLGISVTDSEVEEMVFGENPHPVIRRQFADSTGQINYQLLQNMASNPEARPQWLKLEEFLRRQRRQQKMSSLVQSTIQVSEADIENYYRRQNSSASVQYVALRYASAPDDSITVTESDLRSYYDNNREDFKRE